MSGLEIAGLVLGTFPIICGAAKEMKPVFANAKSWWKFETSFENFIADIRTQEIAYRQVLERLVEHLDVSEDESNSLVTEPHASLWREMHIREGLESRFRGEKYRWIMDCLRELNQAVLDLQSLLPVKKAYLLDSTGLESELYRFQTSFSNEKDRLLNRITTINNDLHTFLDRSSEAPVKPKTTSKLKVPFKEVQVQAQEVYECLAKQQPCQCPTDHVIGIATYPMFQPRKTTESQCLSMLVETESVLKQLRVQVETISRTPIPSPVPPSVIIEKPAYELEAAAGLKREIGVKKHHDEFSLAVKKNSVAALAASSLSIAMTPESELSRPRSILKKAKQKLQKRSSLKAPPPAPVQSQTQTQTQTMTKVSSVPILSTQSSTTLSHTETQTSVFSSVSTSTLSMTSTTTSLPSKVRFGAENAPQSGAEPSLPKNDLSICQIGTEEVLDGDGKHSLQGSKEKSINFSPATSPPTEVDAENLHKIDGILTTLPQRLERLYVGVQLTLTLLSLVNSAWASEHLSVDHIAVIGKSKRKPGEGHIPYFLSHTSKSIQEPISSRWHAKSSLLLLGVLLLELFHGERLEQQKCWDESLAGGEANEYTRFCSAFLWGLQAKEALEKFLGKDVGGGLAEAIRKCVCFDFGHDDEFGDSKLVDVVYREVVVPLEKCCPPYLL